MKTLNITNGSCAVDAMIKAGVAGDFLSWDDVLHCGPVPKDLSLEQLSSIRAHFIADQGWAPLSEAISGFSERDRILNHFDQYRQIILWFEHDLYDQLQLLQILDWFSNQKAEISLICTNQYLGAMSDEELTKLIGTEYAVTPQQFLIARKAWNAFCQDQPGEWLKLLQDDTSPLPFLHSTIIRLLEEYPRHHNGLSRSQEAALTALNNKNSRPAELFSLVQQQEEAIFMGDLVFMNILNQFKDCLPSLIKGSNYGQEKLSITSQSSLSLTDSGLRILNGQSHWLENKHPDYWIGGVHQGPNQFWCWDKEEMNLRRLDFTNKQ